jgi:hypothetical protein
LRKEDKISWFEKNPKTTWGIFLVFLLILIETVFSFVYTNHYKFRDVSLEGQTYWNHVADPSRIYDTKEIVKYRTNKYGEILSGKQDSDSLQDAYFFGSSQVQSYFVQEGKRWPDLVVGFNTHNYGVTGNYIHNSYYNLKYLINKGVIKKGSTIFVLQGMNDLSRILGQCNKSFINLFPIVNNNFLLYNPSYKSNSFKRFIIKYILPNSTTLSFFADLVMNNMQFNKYVKESSRLNPEENLQSYLNQSLANKQDSVCLEDEFNNYLPKFELLVKERLFVLEEITAICNDNDLTLVLLTQPNSFLEDYQVSNGIYMLPIYNQKNLDRKQSRILLELLNNQTQEFAKKHNIFCIDINNEFLKHNPNELFYDQSHFTEKGCVTFSNIINESLLNTY